MSTLNVSNITDGTTTVGTSYVVNGSAKGWVQFDTNDNPPVADGSFNVSSLTDDGAEIEVNITNAMSNSLFSPVGSSANTAANPSNRLLSCGCVSASIINTEQYSAANAAAIGLNHVAWFGDLA
jgi:hypothetical protein